MAWGTPMQVVATGDSITCQYWSSLPNAFNNLGVSVSVPDPNYSDPGSISTSRSGMSSSMYGGQSGATNTTESPINYAGNVLNANPDAILFMLGVNDLNWGSDVDPRFNAFKANLTPVFDNYANFTNSQGQHPKVVIGSILPFDCAINEAYWTQVYGKPMSRGYDVMAVIATWNAWLKQQAEQHGFVYLDNYAAIQQVPDWNTTLMGPDGLHLTDQGSQWVASQFASAILVPEPSVMVLLGMSASGLFAWARRQNRISV
jgi:lysophospholipase L1-like esterase